MLLSFLQYKGQLAISKKEPSSSTCQQCRGWDSLDSQFPKRRKQVPSCSCPVQQSFSTPYISQPLGSCLNHPKSLTTLVWVRPGHQSILKLRGDGNVLTLHCDNVHTILQIYYKSLNCILSPGECYGYVSQTSTKLLKKKKKKKSSPGLLIFPSMSKNCYS